AVTSSDEELLAVLEAERAVYRTFLRYTQLVDSNQHERVADECFTPDVVVDYQMLPGIRQLFCGRDEWNAYVLPSATRRVQWVAHVIGQTTIEWKDGRPHRCAYATGWHWYKEHASKGDLRPADWATIGFLEDDYEQVDGTWLIARRTLVPVGGVVAA